MTEKDCDCFTHDGPHWLHMDRLWQEQNRAILEQALRYEERAIAEAARCKQALHCEDYALAEQALREANQWIWLRDNQIHCYAQAELVRLAEKERHLKPR